jgi:hypothetical protein
MYLLLSRRTDTFPKQKFNDTIFHFLTVQINLEVHVCSRNQFLLKTVQVSPFKKEYGFEILIRNYVS